MSVDDIQRGFTLGNKILKNASSIANLDEHFSDLSSSTLATTISALRLLLLIALYYIMVSVILYGVGAGKFKRVSELDFSGGEVYKAMLFTCVLCTLRVTWSRTGYETVSVLFRSKNNLLPAVELCCKIHYKIISVLTCLTMFMVDVTLWFRQRLLLRNASFAAACSASLVFLSKYCIYALGGCWLALLVLFFQEVNSNHIVSTASSKCSMGVVTTGSGLSVLVLTVCNQIAALLLFVYPLKKFLDVRRQLRVSYHRSEISSTQRQQTSESEMQPRSSVHVTLDIDNVDSPETSSLSCNKTQTSSKELDNVVRTMSRRTFLACMMGILPHILVPFLQILGSDYPASVKFFMGDVAIATNVVGVLFTITNISIVLKLFPRFLCNLVKADAWYVTTSAILSSMIDRQH